ncbi:hypothetical protein quinque_011843 [Culex quinquefasciatus]
MLRSVVLLAKMANGFGVFQLLLLYGFLAVSVLGPGSGTGVEGIRMQRKGKQACLFKGNPVTRGQPQLSLQLRECSEGLTHLWGQATFVVDSGLVPARSSERDSFSIEATGPLIMMMPVHMAGYFLWLGVVDTPSNGPRTVYGGGGG